MNKQTKFIIYLEERLADNLAKANGCCKIREKDLALSYVTVAVVLRDIINAFKAMEE